MRLFDMTLFWFWLVMYGLIVIYATAAIFEILEPYENKQKQKKWREK